VQAALLYPPEAVKVRRLASLLVAIVLLAVLVGEAGPATWLLARAGKSRASVGCPCKVKMPCCLEGRCMLGRRGQSPGPAWDTCPEHGPRGALPLSAPPAVLAAFATLGPPGMGARTFSPGSLRFSETYRPLLVPPPRPSLLSSLAV
jgi:hypothetical protein